MTLATTILARRGCSQLRSCILLVAVGEAWHPVVVAVARVAVGRVVPLAAAAAEADVVAEVAAVAAVVEAAVLPSNGLIFSACAFRDRRGKGGCKRRDTGVLLFVEPTLRGSPLASQRVLPRT